MFTGVFFDFYCIMVTVLKLLNSSLGFPKTDLSKNNIYFP